MVKFAADGPGRLSISVSRACWTGPPPSRSPRAATGHDRLARSSRRSPPGGLLADSGSEPGATRARSSSNRPLEQPGTITGLSHGWAGQSPSQSRLRPLTSDRTPAADVDAPRSFARWGIGIAWFVSHRSLLCETRARGSSVHRTRPWPRRHSLQGWSAVFLKPQLRPQHERPGFPTANDHYRTTSRPHLLISQWPNSTGADRILLSSRSTSKSSIIRRRRIQVEVEAPGTPEEVWQAIASGPGVSSWFVPVEFEERDGKPVAVKLNFGPGHGFRSGDGATARSSLRFRHS